MTDIIEKLPLTSMDMTDFQREKLKALFPEVFTEGGKIDFDKLRLTLGETVEAGKERFGLNWAGKSECFQTIKQSSVATLVPARDESVDFDTTENLYIEGDNLEVLKLLQKSYLGKVKMIYIDPPYNTGNDFIYPDNYAENLNTYLEYTGQVDGEGRAISTNKDTDGRFHSKWLNMMYPRLFLAKNLLREDGVIFISIDDNEVHNLRALCNEIFYEDNFIAELPRLTKKAGKTTDSIAKNNDYILCFRKSEKAIFNNYEHTDDGYKYEDDFVAERGKYKLNQTLDYGSIQYSPSLDYEIELEGKILRAGNVSKEEMEQRQLQNPKSDFCWRWSKNLFEFGLKNGFVVLKETKEGHRIYTKTYESATISKNTNGDYFVEIVGRTKSATTLDLIENEFSNDNSRKDLGKIFTAKVFDYSKPVALLKVLAFLVSSDDDIILDFFSGSATTAHAVLDLNKEDGGNRKFIMVQLPEPCDKDSEAFKAGYKNIAEIGKERIRRVINKIKTEQTANEAKADLVDKLSESNAPLDLGFKVFKLQKSNFKVWDANIEKTAEAIQFALDEFVDHINPKAEQEAILFELLLKSGFELTTPIEKLTLSDKTVFSIADGALLICLEKELTHDVISDMAKRSPSRVICLDEGFQNNDQLKTNAVLIMKNHGVEVFRTV